MKSRRPVERWVVDIVERGALVAEYTSGLQKYEFLADRKTQLAVIKCIEVIGEASGQVLRLRPNLAASRPELEFAQANRMRNRLVHGYYGIDAVAVWNAAVDDVPKLVSAAKSLIESGDAS